MNSDLQQLPGHPQVYVEAWDYRSGEGQPGKVYVHYRGPAEALIAAAVATPDMLDLGQRGRSRTDADGDQYLVDRLWYQPMDGTARYWRWQITLSKPLERALQLPGASDAWAWYDHRREAEDTLRAEARRPVQRLITADAWRHGAQDNRITRADAVRIAIDYLCRHLRASLDAYESWLPESVSDEKCMLWILIRTPVLDLPDFAPGNEPNATTTEKTPEAASSVDLRITPFPSYARPRTPASPISPIEPEPNGRPVWKITVPHDLGRTPMVGSSRIITIDARTGAILSDGEEGE